MYRRLRQRDMRMRHDVVVSGSAGQSTLSAAAAEASATEDGALLRERQFRHHDDADELRACAGHSVWVGGERDAHGGGGG